MLVADDYSGMYPAVTRLLMPSCELVGHVADGTLLLETIARLVPDVVVLDVNLQQVNGLEACRQIKAAAPHTKVIVFSASVDDAIKEQAMAVGASAFVSKFRAADDLLLAIQRSFFAG